MPFTYELDTARLIRVARSLDMASDPDFDVAAHPQIVNPRPHSPYFAEWEFDLPEGAGHYFEDEAGALAQAAIAP